MLNLRARCLTLIVLCSLVSPVLAQKTPEEELATLVPASELAVALFAAEPMVINPAAIDVDTQGRVWVAEIQHYRSKAKQPAADSIKVLEDTDGDGKADRVTVFAEGIFCPMSICVAGPRVYVATSPDLWVYEDRDGDLRADGPPTKLLTGFGGVNHDHGAHSLVLGPDHKWWMSHGDGGFDITASDGSQAKFQWGGLLRGELDGTQIELVAQNFRNPYEVAVNSFGEAYLSDNDNDGNRSTRICWILEGGDYGWFGGPPAKVPAATPFAEGWHFRAHLPGYVPGTIVTGFGSPSGMCYYEGDAFGQAIGHAPLHADPGPRELRAYPHASYGAGKRGRVELLLSTDGDAYFRPVDVCVAPDGSLFVADWYDGGVGGHAYNNPDQGRIFRLTPAKGTCQRRDTAGPYESLSQAMQALASPNLATQFLAREYLLAHPTEATAALVQAMETAPPHVQARCLWLLDRMGDMGRGRVRQELAAKESSMRALAVRILRRHGKEELAAILPLASDASPEARREVILACRGVNTPQVRAAWIALANTYDGGDRYLLEALNIGAQGKQAELLDELTAAGYWNPQRLPLMQVLSAERATQYVVEQLAQAETAPGQRLALISALATLPTLEAGKIALGLVGDQTCDSAARKLACDALAIHVKGTWADLVQQPEFNATWERLLSQGEFQARALQLIGLFGWRQFEPQVTQIAQDVKAADAARGLAIEALAAIGGPAANGVLSGLVDDEQEAVRHAALAGLVRRQAWEAIAASLKQPDKKLPPETIVQAMLSNPAGALMLARWIEQNELTSQQTSMTVKLAAAHTDANVRAVFDRHLTAEQRGERLGEKSDLASILRLSGDGQRGREIFFSSSAAACRTCHAIHGTGGDIGPDLSLIGKKYDRGALLETILDPSKAMAPEYVPHLLETKGGRIYLGFVAERRPKQVVLRDVQGNFTRVGQDDIEQLVAQSKSLMPELVLRDVTAQDAADLLAFLAGLTQSVQPVQRLRVCGPTPSEQLVDAGLLCEELASRVDSKPEAQPRAAARTWEAVSADEIGKQFVFDQVAYDQARGKPSMQVTHDWACYADSSVAQDATFEAAGEVCPELWLNGEPVVVQGLSAHASPWSIPLKLRSGRNVILIRQRNEGDAGQFSLSLVAPQFVVLRTD
jgi:putative membrane-bound dehydrogenase-like protein